jgi:cell wall-associated NlpC family hydrolase
MQAEEVGVPVPDWEREGLKRGDLVFWDGHVGIMTNAEMFIHANAYHMAVKHESFEEARARIEAAGFPVTAVRRLLSGAVKAR